MLNCYTHQKNQNAISLLAFNRPQLNDWLVSQDQTIKNMVASLGFVADVGQTALLFDKEGSLTKVLVGMGDENDLSVFGTMARQLPEGVYVAENLSGTDSYHAYLSWGLGNYQFTAYKKSKPLLAKLYLPESYAQYGYLKAILDATYLVRDLINTPANDMMPSDLTEAVMNLAEKFGGKVETTIGDDLLAANYPTIHTVGRASHHAPRLIDFRWGNEAHPKVTLVGKGVCFDSGGLDLKTASGMLGMKKDMGGAAHVIGLAYIIMSLGLPIRLRVLISAVENAVSGNAYHPGDIIVTRKGLSVEVTNTDAEGRLILSDALCEASTEHPELLLDFATLTGAARVGLGTDLGGFFTTDDDFAQKMHEMSEREHDYLWRLPLHKPYRRDLDSKVADIMNTVLTGYGGAITAALFLKEFVGEGICWGHFDIMAANVKNTSTGLEGGEAHTLRAVARYLCERFPA
ncbi:MAG: leucyl aminopeptidase family protein [Gammaproteobacteria bacterium]|jgi:leucyl aminopeptidase|nr:leucyl aminopeptidase family protein [Gammaproteobacteria bacterium]